MRNLLTVLILLLMFACKQTHTEYWHTGHKKHEYTTKKGEKHGEEKRWFQTGRLQSRFDYKNGKLHGTSTRWYYNGNKERKDTYENGKLNGITRLWNEDGKISIKKEFRNDTLHGIYKEWFDNGQQKVEGQHYNNMYHGAWTYYNAAGFKVGSGIFDKGTGVLKGFRLNGSLKRKVHYKDNKKHGEELWYDTEGNLERRLIFENDRIVSSEVFCEDNV